MISEEKGQKLKFKQPIIPLLIWLIMFMILITWLWPTLFSLEGKRVEIPYTVFISELKDKNISRVYIDGDRIIGDFKNPFLWNNSEYKDVFTATEGSEQRSYKEFITVYPEEIGDKNLLQLLEENKVLVSVKSQAESGLFSLLISWLPLLLIFVFFIWMVSRASGQQSNFFKFGRSQARKFDGGKSGVTFKDVAGVDEAISKLQQEVDFLMNPKKYHDLGARIPKGILLVGPPGTGKTLIAKAVAGEASVPFFYISASEFVEMFVGIGASRVRDLFERAKKEAPSIVFIDELDAVARRRGTGMGTVNDEREQTLNQLLVEMDGFDERQEVIILAATNRPDVLDPALIRPGRFDRQVVIGIPDLKGREGILKIHTRKFDLDNVDLNLIARTTTGMCGADLANLCNEAALLAAQYNHKKIAMSDFEEALDTIFMGEKRHIIIDDSERRVIAYHEAGHAIVAWFTPTADEVHKVTIVPRGLALGATEQIPAKDKYNLSRTYLVARLGVLLGGRTAEQLAFNDVTTGAENDLIEATNLARKMVARWGMGNLGLLAFKMHEEQPFLGYELTRGKDYSEVTATEIDKDVRNLLDETHRAVYKLLTNKRDQLDSLADTLFQRETVDKDVLIHLLGQRPRLEVIQKNGNMLNVIK